jgi:hypothetical protein
MTRAREVTASLARFFFASNPDAAHKFSYALVPEGNNFNPLFNGVLAGGFDRRGGNGDCGAAGCAVHLFSSCLNG